MRESLYPIKGSDVVFRETGNSLLDIQRNGGTPTDVTIDNGVMGFNGTTSYIDTNKTFEGIFKDSFSIEMRIKPTDGRPSATTHLFSLQDGTPENRISCIIRTTGEIRFNYESNNNLVSATSSVVFSDGQQDWKTWAFVADSSISGDGGLKIYVDGVLNGTANTSAINFNEYTLSIPIYIGGLNNNGSLSNSYNGDIDYINIYNKALTAAEVSNLYHKRQYKGLVRDGLVGYWDFTKGSSFDRSFNNNNGTDTLGVGGYKKQGLDFDGADTNIAVADATNIQNIFDGGGTIFAVINPRSDGEANQGRIVDKIQYNLRLQGVVANKATLKFAKTFSGVTGVWETLSPQISLDKFFSVVITYNADAVGNDPLLSVNAINVNLSEIVTPVGARMADVGSELSIGNNGGGIRTFDGFMKTIVMFNRILSATELAQLQQWAKTTFNLYDKQ